MRVVGQLLSFLSSEDSKDVFTIMTSNNSSSLPPELTRSGRIDTIWYFGLPDLEERKEIFKIHFNKCNKEVPEELINYAAISAQNFTGAEIKETVKVTIRKAYNRFKKDKNPNITKEDIDNAIPEIIPVYNSSKETIKLLEQYYKDRARWSNVTEEEVISSNNKNDDTEIINFDID